MGLAFIPFWNVSLPRIGVVISGLLLPFGYRQEDHRRRLGGVAEIETSDNHQTVP
jgi:hypothetical protein